MTIDEQIKILESNSEFERKEGDLQGCLNFRQLSEWLKELKAYREAWENIDIETKNKTREQYDDDFKRGMRLGFEEALDIIRDREPKEGDAE